MLRKIISHLCIVLSGMCFFLYWLDVYKGGSMSFMNNGITKGLCCALSVVGFVTAVTNIRGQNRENSLRSKVRKLKKKSKKTKTMVKRK